MNQLPNINNLDEALAAMSSSNPRVRAWGILALKNIGYSAQVIMRVGQLLHDEATWDPSPGVSTGPIPKYIPTVKSIAETQLKYIGENSTGALLEIIHTLPFMDSNTQQIAIDVFNQIYRQKYIKILLSLEENDLILIYTTLRQRVNPDLEAMLEVFSSPIENRPERVIVYMASIEKDISNWMWNLSDLGSRLIPYLRELIIFNIKNPHPLSYLFSLGGIIGTFRHGTVKYITALETILILKKMGPNGKIVLLEMAQSPVKKIRLASEKAIKA
jgi:hypothetical protein